jgi:hypothetical protein
MFLEHETAATWTACPAKELEHGAQRPTVFYPTGCDFIDCSVPRTRATVLRLHSVQTSIGCHHKPSGPRLARILASGASVAATFSGQLRHRPFYTCNCLTSDNDRPLNAWFLDFAMAAYCRTSFIFAHAS